MMFTKPIAECPAACRGELHLTFYKEFDNHLAFYKEFDKEKMTDCLSSLWECGTLFNNLVGMQ